eukprot:scaffold2679_cov140-Amphora_coffeaeformis.AAC.4
MQIVLDCFHFELKDNLIEIDFHGKSKSYPLAVVVVLYPIAFVVSVEAFREGCRGACTRGKVHRHIIACLADIVVWANWASFELSDETSRLHTGVGANEATSYHERDDQEAAGGRGYQSVWHHK